MLAVNHILSKRDGLAHHFARVLRCGADKWRAAALEFFNRFRAAVYAGDFNRTGFAVSISVVTIRPEARSLRDAC